MDLLLTPRDGVTELVLHGLGPQQLMAILAGALERGKGLVKHLDISEHQGIEGVLADGDFPHENVGPGCWLFDANVAVTFLANVHVRRAELLVLPEWPEDPKAREALLAPGELYPVAFRAHGGTFYCVTPNEDMVSLACADEALIRRVFVNAVKGATYGRLQLEPLEGEDALYETLAPLATDPALHVRRRRGDYPGELHATALGHATVWVRSLVRRKLNQRPGGYRYPAQVLQREIVAVPNANRITVSPERMIPLRAFFGMNRWLFDRLGPVYFAGMVMLVLGALCPAATLLTEGATPVGGIGLALAIAASWALADVARRE